MPHALIVEDDADSAEMLATLIAGEGFSTAVATSLKEARQQLILRDPDLILLDLILPDGNGMELFDKLEPHTDSEIVLITGHASLETSIQALRLGAADYLIKPLNVTQLKGILSRVTRPAALQSEIGEFRKQAESEGRFGRLWGRSAALRTVHDQIARVAGTAATVLITGESGTGKELVAQTIHDLSRRRKQPFVPVNCGAISPELIESEMFGHEKGSFTGAHRDHRGYFEGAHGGTLFLDEITEMPPDLQVKLLRVLETGTFMRVGSGHLIDVDVRIIAATNRVPEEAVASGKLREDLFYRLNVFHIHVPPLRERPDDVEFLAQHFLAELSDQEGVAKHFTADALAQLRSSNWPGNVRQLKNAVLRAFIMAEGDSIDASSLPSAASLVSREDSGPTFTVTVGMSIAEVERRLIMATLEQCGGHKEKAAEILGVSPKTLYNRLREYGREGNRSS